MKLTKRISIALIAGAAGFLASHLVKLAWRAVSGEDAPEEVDNLALPTVQVTVFAAVVAAATAVAETLGTRKALTLFRRAELNRGT
jgi:phosphopantothenoylcysteine synthetase/decarboxylase